MRATTSASIRYAPARSTREWWTRFSPGAAATPRTTCGSWRPGFRCAGWRIRMRSPVVCSFWHPISRAMSPARISASTAAMTPRPGRILEYASVREAARSTDDFRDGLRLGRTQSVCIAGGRVPVLVGFGDDHVQAAEYQDADRRHQHGVVDVPRIIGTARPQDVDDGAHAVGKSQAVDQPAPGTQGEGSCGPPALGARDQGAQHDHLKRNVNADGRETDDGGDGVLQPQRR